MPKGPKTTQINVRLDAPTRLWLERQALPGESLSACARRLIELIRQESER